jgi:hypothetical protein
VLLVERWELIMFDDDGFVDIFFDLSANALQNDYARDQIHQSLTENFQRMVPDILDRMVEITPFVTAEISAYVPIIGDAKRCYELGLFRGAVVLTGVAAESFASDLYSHVDLLRDGINLKKALFKRPRAEQIIDILFLDGAISRNTGESLHRIRTTRNKYVHPDHESISREQIKKDALLVLNKFHEILSTRFSERYYFQNGKIYPR